MHNPVDWRPWGEEALAAARAAEKPLLVSIGYSACHWCHVMERESFEDPETAALMNELFVCDQGGPRRAARRRPDLHGHGGAPAPDTAAGRSRCSARRTGGPSTPAPTSRPSRATACPPSASCSTAIDRTWREQRSRVDDTARQILAALAERPRGVANAPPGAATVAAGARALLESADVEHGGFGGGPKFPTPTNLALLLAACDVLPADEAQRALDFVRFSCGEMARRGLWDHLGGGFHRYCVDGHWGVPHFEKMLYDQGQLLRIYTDVWRRSGERDDDLAWPVRETAALAAPRDDAAPRAASTGARTPTAKGTRAASTCGRRPRSRPCSAPSAPPPSAAPTPSARRATSRARTCSGTSRAARAATSPPSAPSCSRRARSASRPRRTPSACSAGTRSRSRASPTRAACSTSPRCWPTPSPPPSSCATRLRGARRALVARVRGRTGEGAGLPRRPRRLARGAARPAPRRRATRRCRRSRSRSPSRSRRASSTPTRTTCS